jgi:hypothetical protein
MRLTLNRRRCGHASLCWRDARIGKNSGRTNVEAPIKSGWKIAEAKEMQGTGASVSFMRGDAYGEFKSRGIQTRKRPFVGNRLWVVPLTDPDGYRIEFASPTDAPEESELPE